MKIARGGNDTAGREAARLAPQYPAYVPLGRALSLAATPWNRVDAKQGRPLWAGGYFERRAGAHVKRRGQFRHAAIKAVPSRDLIYRSLHVSGRAILEDRQRIRKGWQAGRQ